jgi:hypothetical protein
MRQTDPANKSNPCFSGVSNNPDSRRIMRVPAGLDTAGAKLWRSIDKVFDFADEPGKVQILAQAARVADVIAELDEAADAAPLTVRGSMGQQVISPFIAEARAQRSLLAQLLARLDLPDTEDEAEAKARRLSTVRGRAAKGNR